jgi:hypothetical protein
MRSWARSSSCALRALAGAWARLTALQVLQLLDRKNTDRRRKIDGKMVNFIAKFEIDEDTTDLSLEITEYDTPPDADYESRLLLEPEAAEA